VAVELDENERFLIARVRRRVAMGVRWALMTTPTIPGLREKTSCVRSSRTESLPRRLPRRAAAGLGAGRPGPDMESPELGLLR